MLKDHRRLYAALYPHKLTKSQLKRVKILELAVEYLATNGLQNLTYAALAKKCRISRPLIHHYYPHLDDLIIDCARFVRVGMQDLAIEALKNAGESAQDKMETYVRSCFQWLKTCPSHYRFWLLFLYHTSLNKVALREHTDLAQQGEIRIQSLLDLGASRKEWSASGQQPTAKAIQAIISGMMLVTITESSKYSHAQIEKLAVDQVLKAIRGSARPPTTKP